MRLMKLTVLLSIQAANGLTARFNLLKDVVNLSLATGAFATPLVPTSCHTISPGLSTLQTRTAAISASPSDIISIGLGTPESTWTLLNSSHAHSSALPTCTSLHSVPRIRPTLALASSGILEKGSWNTGFRWPSLTSKPPSPSRQTPSAYLPPWWSGTSSPSSYSTTLTWSPAHSSLHTGSKTSSSILSPTVPTLSSMGSSAVSSTRSTPAIVVVPITTVTSWPAIVVVPVTPKRSILAHDTHISVVGKAPEVKDTSSPTSLHHMVSYTQTLSSSFYPTTTTTHKTVTITLPAQLPSCTHSTAASDDAIYTTVPPVDPRCPYPLPGIECDNSGPNRSSTFVTQTNMGKGAGVSMSVTERERETESKTSVIGCPYPGQKC